MAAPGTHGSDRAPRRWSPSDGGVLRRARRRRHELRRQPLRARPRAVPQPDHRRHRDVPARHRRSNWRLVQDNPHVIGDFTWTGWDYLGEVGIGRVAVHRRATTPPAFAAPFPWLAAWVRRHRHHRAPAAHVLLPRDRLRAAHTAIHRRSPAARPRPRPPARSRGRGATRSPAGPGTPAGHRPPTSRCTATPTRSNCSSTAARIGRDRSAGREAVPRPLRDHLRARRTGSRRLRGGEERARTCCGPPPARSGAPRRRPDAIRADDTDLAYVAIALETPTATSPPTATGW